MREVQGMEGRERSAARGYQRVQAAGLRAASKITSEQEGKALTPKEYLQQYRYAVKRARAALDHLHELESMATRITPIYGGEGGGQHQSGDEKLCNAVDKIIEAKNRVSDELEMLEATERDVVKTIDSITDKTLSTLLYERYINDKTFERIAVELNYSWRQTIRLHGTALMAVKNVIECHT
jgi:uncharacterized protein YukE